MSSSGTNSSGGGGEQWAWLGLLKWTLAHQDGTIPSSESPTMMSDEDRAFLEKVMEEGIIDEGERMVFILKEFSKAMEYYKGKTVLPSVEEETEAETEVETTEEEKVDADTVDQPVDEDDLEDLLQELRDIVEQVDYARGFVNMKGCTYLLGAIGATIPSSSSSSPHAKPPPLIIPNRIRNLCLGILATLAQNNPPVQKELVEIGALKTLSDLILLDDDGSSIPISTKTKAMQALSAIVRCYDLTEAVFEGLPQAPLLMVRGLRSTDAGESPSAVSLNLKTLFFLRAFVTSDTSTPKREENFRQAISMVVDTDSPYLKEDDVFETSVEAIQLRESALALIQELVERKQALEVLLPKKEDLVSFGIRRIQKLRSLNDEAAEKRAIELQYWESLLVKLGRLLF